MSEILTDNLFFIINHEAVQSRLNSNNWNFDRAETKVIFIIISERIGYFFVKLLQLNCMHIFFSIMQLVCFIGCPPTCQDPEPMPEPGR